MCMSDVCLSLCLLVFASFVQHVHKMLHDYTLQTLRHQALWHSNKVGNLRKSCTPSGIRHQHFQVPGDTSSIKKGIKHLQTSSSIQEYHCATSLKSQRWVCQAVGLAEEVDAWLPGQTRVQRPPHNATSYSARTVEGKTQSQ